MSTIRDRLELTRPLPEVSFDIYQTQDWEELTREKMHIISNDVQIGQCNLVSHLLTPRPYAHFDRVDVDENKRRQGFGLATYLLAIELSHSRGRDFETQNYAQTKHAAKIWEFLHERGIAEEIIPFRPSVHFEDRVEGKYRIAL